MNVNRPVNLPINEPRAAMRSQIRSLNDAGRMDIQPGDEGPGLSRDTLADHLALKDSFSLTADCGQHENTCTNKGCVPDLGCVCNRLKCPNCAKLFG